MRGEPLAYFLTWTSYGTWLPGDERGWVAKPGAFRKPNPELQEAARQLMTEPELILDNEQRRIVEQTIADHCRIRHWHLHVVNVRTNHVHVVVTANGRDPEDVLNQFKAWCTRKLKEHALRESETRKPEAQAKERNLKPEAQAKDPDLKPESQAKEFHVRQNWWTQRGSKRQLYNETALENAILYVRDCQD
jgi:REP element-mobilizing transposase RayT